jgi:hypothetical protein
MAKVTHTEDPIMRELKAATMLGVHRDGESPRGANTYMHVPTGGRPPDTVDMEQLF